MLLILLLIGMATLHAMEDTKSYFLTVDNGVPTIYSNEEDLAERGDIDRLIALCGRSIVLQNSDDLCKWSYKLKCRMCMDMFWLHDEHKIEVDKITSGCVGLIIKGEDNRDAHYQNMMKSIKWAQAIVQNDICTGVEWYKILRCKVEFAKKPKNAQELKKHRLAYLEGIQEVYKKIYQE